MHTIRNILNRRALIRIAPAFFWTLTCLFSACEDRLPSDWGGVPGPDSLSDNAFVLDGDGYRSGIFNLQSRSARAYYFVSDDVTSILNADTIVGPHGDRVAVVVHLSVPGGGSGNFSWANALQDPAAKCKVRILIGNVEYVSITGATQMLVLSDPMSRRVRGSYSGVIQSGAGKQVILSNGRFDGAYF